MTGDQYGKFEEIMERAALLTVQQQGKDWEKFVMIMFEELSAYDLKIVEAAVTAHVRSQKFFPTLADITTRIEGSAETRAALAWAHVVTAIERFGHCLSVRFPSPAYHYAIGFMGGWQKLSATLMNAEIKWRGKDFAQFFTLGECVASWGCEPGKVHVPPYLAGWHEVNNRRSGYALPDVINTVTGKPIQNFRAALPEPGQGPSKIVMQLSKGMKAG